MSYQILFESECKTDNVAVSIIIPCYNSGDYIEEAIVSAENQTYKDVEVVVIDDGSTCAMTVEKINSLVLGRGRVIRQENKGLPFARNTAIREAKGQYILPLDADDILDSRYVEFCLPLLLTDKSVGVAFSQTRLFGGIDARLELAEPRLPEMLFANAVVATAIFRKCHWEEFGGYKESMSAGLEDHEFWMNFHEKGLRFERIEEELFFYRQHQSSMSKMVNPRPENYRAMMMNIYCYHKPLYKDYIDEVFLRFIDIKTAEIKWTMKSKKQKKIFSFYLGKGKKLRLISENKN